MSAVVVTLFSLLFTLFCPYDPAGIRRTRRSVVVLTVALLAPISACSSGQTGTVVNVYKYQENFFDDVVARCNAEAAGRYTIVVNILPRAADGQREARRTGEVILGIRPEHFEDAALIGDEPGGSVAAPIEAAESMGSDIFAYFTVHGDRAQSSELQELAADAGDSEIDSDGISARRAPE